MLSLASQVPMRNHGEDAQPLDKREGADSLLFQEDQRTRAKDSILGQLYGM